jgi:hypothetical protein
MSLLTRAVVTTTLVLLPAALHGQENRTRVLSPRDSTVQSIGDARLVVDYGRPSKRGRDIFGALVPYERIWRTGANKATHLSTDRDLVIGDVRVPKGTYTLYTIPSRESWTLIINRQTGQWGTDYDQRQDVGRVPMKVETLSSPVEQFTIALESAGKDTGSLKFLWDATQASVPIRIGK